MSTIKDFTLSLSDLKFVGNDLSRPEFVLPDNDGTLWISDSRALVTRLDPKALKLCWVALPANVMESP